MLYIFCLKKKIIYEGEFKSLMGQKYEYYISELVKEKNYMYELLIKYE